MCVCDNLFTNTKCMQTYNCWGKVRNTYLLDEIIKDLLDQNHTTTQISNERDYEYNTHTL